MHGLNIAKNVTALGLNAEVHMSKSVWNKWSYIVLLALILSPLVLYAESELVYTGNASAKLDFRINVPEIIFLRIGSLGATIDTVEFIIDDPNIPSVTSTANITINVSGIIHPTTEIYLDADSSSPLLGNLTGNTIPFSKISCDGSDDFSSISSQTFNETSSQRIWQSTGSGIRSGALNFTYDNSTQYEPDSYNGTVTYTLSAP